MNRFEAERAKVQRMKEIYPPGTRIMLISMGDDPRPIEPNTRGTVRVVDDIGTLHCNFDNGRQLGLKNRSMRAISLQNICSERLILRAKI